MGLLCFVELVGASPPFLCHAGSQTGRCPKEVFVKGCIAVPIITITHALEQGPD